MRVQVLVAQSYLILWDPMDRSPPGSSVHGTLQARILERVAMLFSMGSSQPRDWIWASCIVGRFFTIWATRVCWVMIIAKEKGQGKGTESTGRGGSEILDRVARKSATRRHREKGWRKWRNQLSRYLGKENTSLFKKIYARQCSSQHYLQSLRQGRIQISANR